VATVQETEYAVDLLRAMLWQYNRASSLQSLVEEKQAWYDACQSEFWRAWFRDVFDLRTCNEFGCQVWAAILGLPLTVGTEPTDPSQPAFAFGDLRENMERGNFGSSNGGSIALTLEQKRLILQLRFFQLISRCTTEEINRFMAWAFRDYGRVFVQDAHDMSFITYVFDFTPDATLEYALNYYDVLPRPSTVGIQFIVTTRDVWGFGDENENFENGNFIPPAGGEL
jgi:hypothetical protein